MEIKESIKKVFSDELWAIDLTDLSKTKGNLVKSVKLARITVNTFAERRMGFQAVALSYFSFLALVPLVAFIFAVTGGLGLTDKVTTILYSYTSLDPGIFNMVIEKATNIIDTAKSSAVGLISALLFVWTILWLMFQVERVFNNVWNIRKIPRKMYKRFSFYFLMLILVPFIVLIFASGIVMYSNFFDFIGFEIGPLYELKTLLSWVFFYAITVFTLSAMFKFIPAAKVRYGNALWSAIWCSLVFTGFQYLYLETQLFVTRLNGVYGALAAIPLFLIWMNLSWQIILYGAQLTYAFGHVDDYNLDPSTEGYGTMKTEQ